MIEDHCVGHFFSLRPWYVAMRTGDTYKFRYVFIANNTVLAPEVHPSYPKL